MLDPKELIGEKMQYIRRACDICCFGFGDLREEHDHKGNLRTVSTYALHIQSAFRLSTPGRRQYCIGFDDVFNPCGGGERPENFEWDIQGGNFYDEKVKLLQEDAELMAGMVVKTVEVSALYDLKITFQNGCLLETFSQCFCPDVELWRFFGPFEDEPHFVITGCGVEEDMEI